MQNKYEITDAELEIMKVLWHNKESSLIEIILNLSQDAERNKNTIKTLLHRLVLKGAVESKKINGKDVVYIPKISEKKFVSKESSSFLQKLFNGNAEKLLLNFIEDKKVTKEGLQRLIDILDEEE